jgi:hypothetical protein
MVGITLLLAGAVSLGAAPHADANPVFQELVTEGVSPGGETFFPLPVPKMPDGLDAAAQRKIITEIAKPSYAFEQFTRNSTVAPQVLHINEVPRSAPQAPLYAVDLYFVAYGNMDAMVNKNFLGNALEENKEEDAEGVSLTPEQLAERKIIIPPENRDYEAFGQTITQLMNNVELSVVARSFWSRTDDSIVTAAAVDPRFNGEQQFPNVWRPLTRDRAGKLVKGDPQPYQGVGMYMKITQLAAPPGALFVEAHAIYHEPPGWFKGQNLLRSKIRAASGQKVKEMRQEMLRAGK